MADIILTGDRPTGKLHLGHYVGSLKNRVKIQNEGNYDKMYVMIADAQALTDNFNNPEKIKESIGEVVLDYLSVGIDPEKTTIFIQSYIQELTELTFYLLNLVHLGRLQRNPTVKSEMKQKGFESSIPLGFLIYPVSQTSDIILFDANIVPVGEDQEPMIEQARELVRSFNSTYGDTFVEPKAIIPENKFQRRLPGIDGNAKMSKSLDNCIYLSDSEEEVKRKVMSMFTDPDHINVKDPGKIEGNIVFTYLDVFATDADFEKYLPEYKNLDELKAHYQRGGLGDVKVKRFLNEILQAELRPIRERRKEYAKDMEKIFDMLEKSSEEAREIGRQKIAKVHKAMGIDYFDNKEYIKSISEKFREKYQ
ncbi:MAG: tryptophan--tRNA ligase [Anaerococcus sp.]